MRSTGYRIDVFWNLICYLSGFAFTATLGKVGETVRSLFLVRKGVPYDKSIALFVCDRFCDLYALVSLGGVFALQANIIGLWQFFLVCVGLLLSVALTYVSFIDRVLMLDCGSRPRLARLLIGLLGIKHALKVYLKPSRFFLSVG